MSKVLWLSVKEKKVLSIYSNVKWIVDLDASQHIIPKIESFTTYKVGNGQFQFFKYYKGKDF